LEFREDTGTHKTRMIGLWQRNYMLSHFDRISERDGRTDRQTDRVAISISSMCYRAITRCSALAERRRDASCH